MYLFMAGEATDTSMAEETVEETVSVGEKIFNSVSDNQSAAHSVQLRQSKGRSFQGLFSCRQHDLRYCRFPEW